MCDTAKNQITNQVVFVGVVAGGAVAAAAIVVLLI
jgi:hypothetical protein